MSRAAITAAAGASSEVLFLTDLSANQIHQVDPGTRQWTGDIQVTEFGQTTAAISQDGRYLYYAGPNNTVVRVVDRQDPTRGHEIAVGGAPSAIALSYDGRRLFVTRQNLADVVAVDGATGAVVWGPTPVGGQPKGIAVSPDGSMVYVSSSSNGTITALRADTGQLISAWPPAQFSSLGLHQLTASPDGSYLYVAVPSDQAVRRFNLASQTYDGVISLGASPFGLVIGDAGSRLYVTVPSQQQIQVFSVPAGELVTTFQSIGTSPYGITSHPWAITVPPPPSPIGPTGAVTVATPSFAWNAAPNANGYELLVRGRTGWVVQASPTAASACSGVTCSFTPGTALAGGTYAWVVRATNAVGLGPWSAAQYFWVGTAPPGRATLGGPSEMIADATPTYTWGVVANAAWYRLVVVNASGGVVLDRWSPELFVCNATGCAVTQPTPLPPGAYWFVVRTWNPAGFGAWSAAGTFTVSATAAPSRAAPAAAGPERELDPALRPPRDGSVPVDPPRDGPPPQIVPRGGLPVVTLSPTPAA